MSDVVKENVILFGASKLGRLGSLLLEDKYEVIYFVMMMKQNMENFWME